MAEPHAAPEQVVQALVSWGARANKLGPYLARAIHMAETANDWPELELLAKKARQLMGPGERGRLLAQAGEALMLSGNPPPWPKPGSDCSPRSWPMLPRRASWMPRCATPKR